MVWRHHSYVWEAGYPFDTNPVPLAVTQAERSEKMEEMAAINALLQRINADAELTVDENKYLQALKKVRLL